MLRLRVEREDGTARLHVIDHHAQVMHEGDVLEGLGVVRHFGVVGLLEFVFHHLS